MTFKFPKKLPKEWIKEIERSGRVGSTFKGMQIVAKDERGVIVKTGKDSFKILHDGKNSEIFGNQNIESNSSDLDRRVRGTMYESGAEDGEADSISVYLTGFGNGENAIAGLYNKDTGDLVGETDEINDNQPDGWVVFPFSEPKPPIIANTEYVLVCHASAVMYMRYASTSVYRYYKWIGSYPSLPDPFDGTIGTASYKFSIYCTYTTGGVTETINVKDFPAEYLEVPAAAKELANKIEGATISSVAKDFPKKLLKAGKAKELRSKWT